MPRLHIYNPDNDLALAANLDNYTPPKAGMRMRQAGALLPVWYGDSGDRVVCYGVNAEWFDRKSREFRHDVELHDHLPNTLEPSPWGWSRAARTVLAREGCDWDSLPTDRQLDELRELSHRATASRIARRIAQLLPDVPFPDPAEQVTSPDEARELMKRWGHIYVKAPWSGSGRGVISSMVNTKSALRQCANFISSQGSAMVEPAMERAADFALLFICEGGKARFIGTSIFTNDSQDHYASNLLAPEAVRRASVERNLPNGILDTLCEAATQAVDEILAPIHDGVLGIDMLVTPKGMVHPAVEVNLRKTMGYAACMFADRYLHPNSRGSLRVLPIRNALSIPPESYTMRDGRLANGLMWLSPPTEHFAIIAEATYSD